MSIEAMRNAVEAMDKHDFEMADHILCQAIAEAEKQEPDDVTKLKGEIGVLVGLLGSAQQVIETIDAENAEESEALIHLHMKITYAIRGASIL